MRIVFLLFFIISVILNIFLILLSGQTSSNFINDLLSSSNYDKLRSMSVLISSVVSIINFGWIISFSISENSKKQNNDRIEKISFWFRDVVIKSNIDKMKQMFDESV
jgi:hypothetical protein